MYAILIEEKGVEQITMDFMKEALVRLEESRTEMNMKVQNAERRAEERRTRIQSDANVISRLEDESQRRNRMYEDSQNALARERRLVESFQEEEGVNRRSAEEAEDRIAMLQVLVRTLAGARVKKLESQLQRTRDRITEMEVEGAHVGAGDPEAETSDGPEPTEEQPSGQVLPPIISSPYRWDLSLILRSPSGQTLPSIPSSPAGQVLPAPRGTSRYGFRERKPKRPA
jgi:predicted RNase H-like nuclease (RuvC/YqgF family)